MKVEHASHCSFRIRYHIVFVLKYRKSLIDDKVFNFLEYVFEGITKRYYLSFHAIGSDKNHLHILVESRPRYSPSEIMKICKSITAKLIMRQFPEIKDELWGGHFWSEGGHIDTIGEGYNESKMKDYIKNQGGDPSQLKLIIFN